MNRHVGSGGAVTLMFPRASRPPRRPVTDSAIAGRWVDLLWPDYHHEWNRFPIQIYYIRSV